MCCFLKYSIAVFNVIITLAGVGLIIIGSLGLKEEKEYGLILPESIYEASIGIIVVGCVVILIGLAGIFGVFKENACILYTCGTVLLLIFAAEVAGVVLLFVFANEIVDSFKTELNETIYSFEMNDTDVQNEVNELQQKLECCGFNGYEDWFVYYPNAVPKSCCRKDVANCSYFPVDENSIYTTGCLDQFIDVLIPIAIGIGSALAVATIAQLLTVICGCCFATSVKGKGHQRPN